MHGLQYASDDLNMHIGAGTGKTGTGEPHQFGELAQAFEYCLGCDT